MKKYQRRSRYFFHTVEFTSNNPKTTAKALWIVRHWFCFHSGGSVGSQKETMMNNKNNDKAARTSMTPLLRLTLVVLVFFCPHLFLRVVEACSLRACPDDLVYAPTTPVDQPATLIIPANATCATTRLPTSCSGCASCDSRYIFAWDDTVDAYACVSPLRPDDWLPCRDLVFGNISTTTSLSNDDFAGHCGWDEDSGRGLCPWADAALMGGVQVCFANDTSVSETVDTVIQDIVLRYVAFACVPNVTTDDDEVSLPEVLPGNNINETTAVPFTAVPTAMPTTTVPSSMKTTAQPTAEIRASRASTLPPSSSAANSLRHCAYWKFLFGVAAVVGMPLWWW